MAAAASALSLWLTACAGQQPRPAVRPPVWTRATAVVRTAESLLGAPYRPGGADPQGFDCSGLVWYSFARHGIALPRNVARLWTAGRPVDRHDVRPAELLFFATTGAGPTHVTLAIDTSRFIHAPNARGVVRVESLSSSYWSGRLVGVRRIVE